MIQLLPVHLINPGTDRVMCTKMRKNCNITDQFLFVTCDKCEKNYVLNREWYKEKLLRVIQEGGYESLVFP